MVNLGIVGRRKGERKREEEEESLRSKPHKRLGKSQIRTQTRIWVVVLLFLFVFLFRFKPLCLTKGKKSVFFAVPRAFTPTCSKKHVPGFVEKAVELKAKGVDTIACISINDAFVLKAWKKALNIGDESLTLSDGNDNFMKAIGVELDLSDNPVGLGVRSRRYSMLVEDGVVKLLNLEEGGAFTFSGAEDILKAL